MPIATLPELKLCSYPNCCQIATGIKSKYCYAHDKTRALKPYSASPKPSARSSKPYIGVELECFNPESAYKVTHVATYVCRDGSLPPNGGEIKLCALENKIGNIAADVAQRATIVGNIVNKRCGFHVHVGTVPIRERNLVGVQNLATLFKNLQGEIFSLMAPSRRDNRFCRLINSENDLMAHYCWASLSAKYPTLEIRVHGATLNAWKVKGWIDVVTQLRPAIMAAMTNSESWIDYKYITSIFDILDSDSIGYKYMLARKRANGSLTSFGFSR